MPFSKENVKFTVLTLGVVLMVCVGVIGIVSIAYSPTKDSTPLYTAIGGFVTLAASQLLNLLRTEQLHTKVSEAKHELKNDLNPIAITTQKTEEKLDAAKEALANGNAPLTKHAAEAILCEMHDVLRQVKEVCAEIKRQPPPA